MGDPWDAPQVPSAPYYPPAFNVASPLQPGMNPGSIPDPNNITQMNVMNQVNPGMGNITMQQPQVTTRVVVGGPGMQFFSPSPNPIPMNCPSCGHSIVTRTQKMTSCLAHVVAGGLCMVGCCCFSCVPYLVDSFNDVEHLCPREECGKFIGVYKRV